MTSQTQKQRGSPPHTGLCQYPPSLCSSGRLTSVSGTLIPLLTIVYRKDLETYVLMACNSPPVLLRVFCPSKKCHFPLFLHLCVPSCLLIYSWLHWVSVAWSQLPDAVTSLLAERGLRAQAQRAWLVDLAVPRRWSLPRPEIEPMSPELGGGFLTTGEVPEFFSAGLSGKHLFCVQQLCLCPEWKCHLSINSRAIECGHVPSGQKKRSSSFLPNLLIWSHPPCI